MRLFGSERLIGMFNALGVPEGQELEHKALTSAIESAQKKIENNNFGIRKNLLEYDRVMSEQREIIYDERRRVLNGESMRDFIYKMITDIAENCVDISINDEAEVEEWNFNELNTLLLPTFCPWSQWKPLENAPGSPPPEVIVPGEAFGTLRGGNLSLVASSIATPWEVDTNGAVLFLEDVGERPYRLDGMLTHLRNSGRLERRSEERRVGKECAA